MAWPWKLVGLDTRLDLAAIRLDEASHQPVGTTRAAKGARGHIVDGSVSGTVPFEVNDIVEVSIEEVLGTQRYKRIGYEVDAATARGDSGAGAYNEEGRLIGVVFAFSTEPQVTWLTSSEELMRFLDIVRDKEQTWQCDSDRSRLAVAEP